MDYSNSYINLTMSPQLREYIPGWDMVERAVDIDSFNMHDAHIDKVVYNGEEDYKDDIDLFLFDPFSRKTIHFRFSKVYELEWRCEMGAAFAWEYSLKYHKGRKEFTFELEALHFRIVCRKIEIISVRNYISPK